MNVVIARVDERLVHGQILTSWIKHLQINQIVIIDDKIAVDPFMYEVLVLSAPSGLKFDVLSTDDALRVLNEPQGNNRVMLLFKTIETVYTLMKKGLVLKELNIGNVSSGPKRKSLTKNVSLSLQEQDQLKELVEQGCHVYLQMLYTDAILDYEKTFLRK